MKKRKILAFALILALLFNVAPLNFVYADENLNNGIKLKMDSSDELVLDSLISDPLKQSITDGHVEIKNISIRYSNSGTSQPNMQIGSFKGALSNNILEFDSGVALSTGDLKKDLDYYQNDKGVISHVYTDSNYSSDTIGSETVRDPASISFDIILKDGIFSGGEDYKEMILQYAFASEEYTQYSDSKFNDRLGVIVNGKNYATVPGTNDAIAIRTINQTVNTEFFRKNTDDNDDSLPNLGLKINLNGLTKTFTSSIKLHKGKNTVKFIIGDFGDSAYDSVLFIKDKSLKFAKFEPGKLSVEKGTGNNIIIKRVKEDNSGATDGTVAFTLVQEDLDGNKTETVFTIADSESEITIPISQEPSFDGTDKILQSTAKIIIKDAKMGASVDNEKNNLILKIPAPILTKDPNNEKNINITGLPNAVVTLTGNRTVNLNPQGLGTASDLPEGDYTATQSLNNLLSLDSNSIKIKYSKPPVISGNQGAFDEISINKNESFDIDSLGVHANKSDDLKTLIPSGPNFSVENTLNGNEGTPGIYTIKWTAKDEDFTVVKTKVVKVRPDKPALSKDFKHSLLKVKGSSEGIVKIYNKKGDLIATVQLNASGDGTFLEPPNGEYTAVQTVNGVDSLATESVEIEREYHKPVISLKGEDDIEGFYSKDGNSNYNFVEPGVKVSDVEDNKIEVQGIASAWDEVNQTNTILTPKVKIINPMINGEGQNIGPDPNLPFEPFVGKYIIKYSVEDSDGMVGEATRTVKVRPWTPEPKDNGVNQNNSSIEIDGISSASLFLYKKNSNGEFKPVRIKNGEAEEIQENEEFTEEHSKIKIDGTTPAEPPKTIKIGKISGLPDGEYKFLQRLYGLNSELSNVIEVIHKDSVPKIVLKGNAVVRIVKGDTFNDEGATYTINDNTGDVHDVTDVNNSVNNNEVGKYKVIYTATNNSEIATVERIVIVAPQAPVLTVGDYADFNGDGNKEFRENPQGNDIQVTNVENGANLQLVRGENGNGALYEKKDNVNGNSFIFENVVDTKDSNEKYGVFQTIKTIQSPKSNLVDINKTNTKPLLVFTDDSIITVEKGKAVSFNKDISNATDNEDDDTELTAKIKIYKTVDLNTNKVTGAGESQINLSASDTNTVGIKEFYYSVTDSDGNSALKIKFVHILPKAPTLTASPDKLTVNNFEPDAVIKLYKQNDDGSWTIFDTKTATGTNPVDFSPLDTGIYKAVQIVKGLESSDSDPKNFNNPAFLNTIVVKDNEANNSLIGVEGVTFEITEIDGSVKKATSTKKGNVLFGVESAGKVYEMKLVDGGNTMFVKGTSSETDGLHTKTTVIGAIETDGKATLISNDKIIAKLEKEEGGIFVDTTISKVVYKDGTYQLNQLENNKKYRVSLSYDQGAKGKLAITKFEVVSGTAGSIKIVDNKLNYGKVTDNTGKLLNGVSVTVYHPDRDKKPDYSLGAVNLPSINALKGKNVNGSLTDAKGEYGYSVYNALPYVLVAKKTGYKDKIIFVENVKGNLLGEDIVMEKDPNADNGSDSSDSSSKEKEDKPALPKTEENLPKRDEKSKAIDNSGLKIIKDIPAKPLLEGAKKTKEGYEATDTVKDGSYLAYDSENKKGKDVIIEKPNKGRIFVNPESGNIIYIPSKNEEGKDNFIIKTKDKNGNVVTLKKNIEIQQQTSQLFGKRTSLILELNSPKRDGFEGDEFKFTVDYKNNLKKDVESATVVINIPEGFELINNKYKTEGSYLLVPVKDLKQGDTGSFDFTLKANSPKAEISEVTALIQEKGSRTIYPEAVSSMDIRVLKLNTRYFAKPYVKGYPNGNFEQNESITRAEVAAMLTRCLNNNGESFINNKTSDFKDVNNLSWYSKYINEAIKFGLFNGFEDGTFKPNKNITRAELSRVISNYLKLDISEAGVIKQHYPDVDLHWARDDINALKRYGISIGYEDGTFRPSEDISREETVKMINNMLYRYKLPKVKSSFGDLNNDEWSFGDIESAYRGYSFEMNSVNKKMNIEAGK